jgi:hypothetical protein
MQTLACPRGRTRAHADIGVSAWTRPYVRADALTSAQTLVRPHRRAPASVQTYSHPCGHERVRTDAPLHPRGHRRVHVDATMRPRGHRPVHVDCPRPPSVPPRLPCSDGLLRPCGCAKKTELKKIKILLLFFGCWLLEKKGKKCSVFGFQSPRSPRSPSSPSSAGFAGEAARRRRFFRPSSLSHPSKLYSSLGWLNSKVPKPFFPFTLRLIDVDGF